MNELIKLFNDDETHIEIDCVNQRENGMVFDHDVYTYTIYLFLNSFNSGDWIDCISINSFSNEEIESVIEYFKEYKPDSF